MFVRRPSPRLIKRVATALTLTLLVAWLASTWIDSAGIRAGPLWISLSAGRISTTWVTPDMDNYTNKPQYADLMSGPVVRVVRGRRDPVWGPELWIGPPNYGVTLPLWIPVAALLATSSLAWYMEFLPARRLRRGLCPACGYQRSGIGRQSRCPECGAKPHS